MEVRFVDGLRVSDEATVEVAKMVLVGKQNKDIVLRLNRHGQPAVGLCGDDGSCSRSASARRGETDVGMVGDIEHVDVNVLNHIAEDYIPVVASVGADREGQLLQRERRRRGRRRRRGARRLQGHLPDRRGGLARRPGRPGHAHLRGHRRRGAPAIAGGERRDAARSSRRASTRSTRAWTTRTSWTGGSRTRCCSSCSRTRAAGRSCGPRGAPGARAARRDGHVRPSAGRVRARRGHPAVGRRTATSTSTSWSGISVVAARPRHPRVVEAVREQAGRLAHVGNLFYTEPAMRLAQRLAASSLGGKVFFCNSGAEAIECAIKLARKRRRPGGRFVMLEGAFHGRTMGALSATRRRRSRRRSRRSCRASSVAARGGPVEAGDDVAAVIIEPVQGERGSTRWTRRCCTRRAMPATRTERCSIFDEIQCGMGRTGTLWAWQHWASSPT